MILKTRLKKRSDIRVAFLVLIVLTCMHSDSVYFEEKERKPQLTTDQFVSTCSPSKIIQLENVAISRGSSWKFFHSNHCQGHKHVVATMNVVGIKEADIHISKALAITYARFMQDSKITSCRDAIQTLKPEVFKSEDRSLLISVHVLDCDDFE